MKKLILFFIVALIATGSSAQIAPVYQLALDKKFDDLCKHYNLKGATAAIVVPNEGIWERSWGESHSGVPINSNMYMGIGSNTKTFTAVLMLKLQEQGKLDLDDTIGTWIQHQNIPGTITIRQLLNHTSGLYSFTSNSAMNSFIIPPYTQVWPIDTVLSMVKAPVAAPGGSWDYSNTNYTVAGIIIRAITSKPIHQAFRDELLAPNGLDDTYFFPQETPAPGLIPHAWSNVLNTGPAMQDLDVDHNYSHNAFLSLASSAGCILSTAKDNAIFWNKLVSGQLLTAQSMTELETLVPISLGQGYGLGIFSLNGFNGRTIITHGGTGFGFINENLADKTSKVSISLLTNQDSISNSILLGGIIRALHQVTIQYTDVPSTKEQDKLAIFPNPAKNKLNVSMDDHQATSLQLFNITGQQILTQSLSNGNNTISLTHLPSGTYYLNLLNKGIPIQKQTITVVK